MPRLNARKSPRTLQQKTPRRNAWDLPLAKLSFDAFGARRGADWTSATAPDWTNIANSTRRGFTFHEQLDAVGLTHMNGRVYDPALGQFLSVDPLIGNLADSQSVHPYAYVGHRPLSFTDPSGYVVAQGCAAACVEIAKLPKPGTDPTILHISRAQPYAFDQSLLT